MPDPTQILGATDTLSVAPLFWWVSPLVTAVAATVAGIVAIGAIRSNRNTARLRATLDHIERTESQDYYQGLVRQFSNVRRANNFEKYIDPSDPDDLEVKADLLNFLNHYELIAMGFRRKILDKKFYAGFMRGAVVRDWEASREYVKALRFRPGKPPRPLTYREFEEMARYWELEIELEKHKVTRRRRRAKTNWIVARRVGTPATRLQRYSKVAVIWVIVVVKRARKWSYDQGDIS